jgi:EAL and modified HD-GYP domain-containing signal transduction protein
MASQSASTEHTEVTPPDQACRYVARQPILDRWGHLHGYELLFRNGPELAFRGDGDTATRTMLDNTVIFGFDRLTGGALAFVNCTGEALIEQFVRIMPQSLTVLELLETLDPTPSLIAACRKLKASGFRLALDDFTWRADIEPLVQLADYIKVDFTALDASERRGLLRRLNGDMVSLVAEKVETQEEYRQACAEGFTLFQGYYFCRPVLLKNRKIPANRLLYIQMIELLHEDAVDLHKLSQLVKRDEALTYRLLRLVNSPFCAIRQEVSSIEGALMVVGEETFRRIATLAIASELNTEQPMELLRMAFARGRFCELAAEICALDSTEQYLLGMLSLLPAMLRVPMEELTPSLPLRERIREALLGTANIERSLLHWMECQEHGDWEGCDAIVQARGLDQKEVAQCYADAVVWAEAALHFTA